MRFCAVLLTCLLLLGDASGQVIGGGSPVSPAGFVPRMLISSRLRTLGQYTLTVSNGTDTGSNSRIAFWNESGACVSQVQVIYSNWYGTLTNETNNANSISISGSIEYPAGTFNQIKWGGSTSDILTSGNVTSDAITLSTCIPSDTQAWIRTFVTVTSTQVWPIGYFQMTSLGEAVDSGTSNTDKTMSGTITNNNGVQGYGPAAVVGIQWATPPRRFALAAIGDSLTQGPGDFIDARGNAGPWGWAAGFDSVALVGKTVPYMNLSIAGQAANSNLPSEMQNRLDLLSRVGATHVLLAYGTNDLATDSPATIENHLVTIGTLFASMGMKVVGQTIPPKTTSTDAWITTANQTPVSPGWNGSPSNYSTLNNWMRGIPSPFSAFAETANSVETSNNSAIWQVGGGTVSTNLTSDGVHWWVIQQNPEFGGNFNARTAILPTLGALCGC